METAKQEAGSEIAARMNEETDVQARTRKAREQKATLEKARTARELAKVQDPAAQLATAERELREAEALEAAETEHGLEADGKIGLVRTALGLIILKRSHPSVVRRHLDAGKSSQVAIETLVNPCIVYPPIDRFEAINRELPYTLTLCGDRVIELAGFQQRDQSGK